MRFSEDVIDQEERDQRREYLGEPDSRSYIGTPKDSPETQRPKARTDCLSKWETLSPKRLQIFPSDRTNHSPIAFFSMNISHEDDVISPARSLLLLAHSTGEPSPAALPMSMPSSKYRLHSSPSALMSASTEGSPKKKLHTTTTTVTKKSTNQKVAAKKSTGETMKSSTKRYNNYNIFFMLERQRLLLQSRGGAMAITVGGVATCSVVTQAVDSVEVNNRPRPSINDITKEEENLGAVRCYTNLVLPALCRRYADLPLSRNNWFEELVATRDSKRRHCKRQGLIPFVDLARMIATNYREVDDETKAFVNEVALRIALYNHDLESKEMKKWEDSVELVISPCPTDRMGLTQKEMKARQRREKEVGTKTLLKNDDPSKNNKARDGAMSTMMTTQLPPRIVHSATMMPRTLTASALPRPMVSYDFELARLRREAEMAAFARIELEQRITQLQMQLYHQLRLQEQRRASHQHASHQHELLNILHRGNLMLTRINNNPGIMGRVSIVPSGSSILSSEDNVDIRSLISGVIPEVINNDLLREK